MKITTQDYLYRGVYYGFLGCSRRHHCSRTDSMLCLMKDGTAVLNGRQCLFVFE